ncbi:hypothetical protein AB0J55_08280 [Amycolatopsis sp. NPDC049688]|uniref:hypothetical protein n=1 Tax=Amycolatopsis sp. NPDC049688 TaxID=3154733 RepID=UPI00342D1B8B
MLFLITIFWSSPRGYEGAPPTVGSPRPTSEEPTASLDTRDPITPPRSPDPGVPQSPPPADPALATFVKECIHKPGGAPGDASAWRTGQVDYPKTLELKVGTSGVYVAAVDVRDQPAPPTEVIPAPSAVGTRIAVRCVLNARLSGDGTLTVDPDDWTARQFNPVGVLNWSWRVTADETGDHDLVLALQPAVIAEDSGEVIAIGDKSRETSTFITKVSVSGSVPQQLGTWWKQNWPAISLVGGGIAGVILASILWGRKVVVGIRDLLKARAPDTGQPCREEKGRQG